MERPISSSRVGVTAELDAGAGVVTALFVPGDDSERFTKVAGSGADVVSIEREDAVAPEVKARAPALALEPPRA